MGEVTGGILEVVLKAVTGGVFVLAFAALAEMITPKRLAGVFCAAPSVALAGLIVTAGLTGVPDVLASARGMQIGAIGFTLYCLIAVPLLRRWGAWWGSLATLAVWGAAVAVGYALAPQGLLAARTTATLELTPQAALGCAGPTALGLASRELARQAMPELSPPPARLP